MLSLHHLTLGELVQCRAVYKPFKELIDDYLNKITYVCEDDGDFFRSIPYNIPMINFYIRRSYFCQKAKVLYTYTSGLKHLFPFLGKFCPNLQVFISSSGRCTYEDILHVASSIEYISLKIMEPIPSELEASPE